MEAPCSSAFPVFLNLNTFIMHSVGLYVLVGTLVYEGACVKARRQHQHHPPFFFKDGVPHKHETHKEH